MLVLLTNDDIALIILGICILPILILMVYAIIVALRKNKIRSREREEAIRTSEDDSQRQLFQDLFGGKDNIETVAVQMSRVSVAVKDLEKVKTEELKEMGATGVLLVGNVVKCSFGDRAPYIYKLLNEDKQGGKND
jgi:glucose-like phosphotransferase system IIB component